MRVVFARLFAVVLVAFLAGSQAAAQSEEEMATQGVWEAHMAHFMSGDLDLVLSDFADDAVIITKGGVFRGLDEIRTYFQRSMSQMTPEAMGSFADEGTIYVDTLVFSNYSIGAYDRGATDVAIVEDGKLSKIVTLDYPME